MQQTKFFLLFLLLTVGVFSVFSRNIIIQPGQPPIGEPFKCNIPAPTNFQVLGVGITNIRLGWDYQPDAAGGYRIRTYRASDQLLVNTTLKGQDQLEAVIDNLEPGTEYNIVINSTCDGGGYSDKEVIIDAGTLIPDLVVIGYQGSSASPLCTINAGGGSCPYVASVGTVNHYRIVHGTEVEEFGVEYVSMPNNLTGVQVLVPTLPFRNVNYSFYCIDKNGNGTPAYFENKGCSNADFVEVRFSNSTYLRFKVTGGATGTGNIEALSFMQQCPLNPNNPNNPFDQCKIEYLGFTSSVGLQAPSTTYTGQRSGLPNTPDFAAVMPNPFNDRLQVWVDDPSVESVHCQLFNVNGQKVLDQSFQGAQETYDLITENLANGFYLLRVEANGMVQTLRVIKAE